MLDRIPIVVAPSLTPEGYNDPDAAWFRRQVVAPSLTPEGYNFPGFLDDGLMVVAPSLTPEGYNPLSRATIT